MFKLTTPRLTIRPYTTEDFRAVHVYCSDPETVRYMTFGPNTEEETMDFLAECERHWKMYPVKRHECAIVLTQTGTVIGGIGLFVEQREGMLGWLLHPDYRRQGYMTEAAGEMMRYGFEDLNLHRQYATCFSDNIPSYSLMEKLGMRREGHYIKNRLMRNSAPDDWRDEYHYAILQEEWKKYHAR